MHKEAKKVCAVEVKDNTDTRVMEICEINYVNRVIDMLLPQLITDNIAVEMIKLPTGSIPKVGRQKLAIDRMTIDVEQANLDLTTLRKYQEEQQKVAVKSLDLMKTTLASLINGYH